VMSREATTLRGRLAEVPAGRRWAVFDSRSICCWVPRWYIRLACWVARDIFGRADCADMVWWPLDQGTSCAV